MIACLSIFSFQMMLVSKICNLCLANCVLNFIFFLLIMYYIRGVKLVSLWGPHCTYEQLCRGPHEVVDLEITTLLGNDLYKCSPK